MYLDRNIKLILDILQENGQGYIVGGYVRDVLLGLEPKDCDFVTDIEYIVSCGSTQYERYRWGWYVCSGCGNSWGESAKWVMQNGSWVGVGFVGENSYDNFLVTYLPSSVACIGYEVINTYTMTSNHYLYNPNTGGWDYWTSTTATAVYGSVYIPGNFRK